MHRQSDTQLLAKSRKREKGLQTLPFMYIYFGECHTQEIFETRESLNQRAQVQILDGTFNIMSSMHSNKGR